jgi:hypothetical protein
VENRQIIRNVITAKQTKIKEDEFLRDYSENDRPTVQNLCTVVLLIFGSIAFQP